MAEIGEISSGNSDGSKKKQKSSEEANDSRYVFLKFVDQKGGMMHLKVRRNLQLGMAFDTYRKSCNLDGSPNFMYNGSRLPPSLSPGDLSLRNGDQIDVLVIPYGG